MLAALLSAAVVLGASASGGPTSLALEAGIPGEPESVRRCAAGRVAPGWLLTAGHCLPDPANQVVLSTDGHPLPVRRVVRHPSHDVVLVEVGGLSGAARVIPVAGLREGAGPLWSSVPGVAGIRVDGLGPHVLRLSVARGCLGRGDSGTPLFQGEQAVAMLIAGSPDCAGAETALRLGPLAPWIREVAR